MATTNRPMDEVEKAYWSGDRVIDYSHLKDYGFSKDEAITEGVGREGESELQEICEEK